MVLTAMMVNTNSTASRETKPDSAMSCERFQAIDHGDLETTDRQTDALSACQAVNRSIGADELLWRTYNSIVGRFSARHESTRKIKRQAAVKSF